MTDEASKILREGKLITSASESTCGINLKNSTLYLIAANTAHIGLCDYAKEYSSMTLVERRGFAGGYKKGCLCDVRKKLSIFKFNTSYTIRKFITLTERCFPKKNLPFVS